MNNKPSKISDQPSSLLYKDETRYSIAIRAAYGLYFAAIGSLLPYFVLYFRELGLSGGEIGVLAALIPLAAMLFASLWGMVADKYSAHRLVLSGALLLSALSALLLAKADTFSMFLPGMLALAFFNAPVLSLLDSYGVVISERHGISYGQLRVWGSIGFTAAAWFVGWLMRSELSPIFIIGFAIAVLLCGVATLALGPLNAHRTPWQWQSVTGLMRQPVLLVLLTTAYLVSTALSVVLNYFGIYLAALGGNLEAIGTANAVASLSELPIMAASGWLLAKFGARRLLALAIAILGSRLIIYTLLPSAEWVMPVQLLHGLTFGLYLLTAVMLVHKLVRKELIATGQGMLGSSFAAGQITGALLGGILLDRFGILAMYQLASIVAFFALAIFVAGVFRYTDTQAKVTISTQSHALLLRLAALRTWIRWE